MKKLVPVILILLIFWSCQTRTPADNQSDSDPVTFSLSELWATDTVMKTPESVLYDAARSVLYVANMNRGAEGDDQGFISKLGTNGNVIDLHWITGLNEPRGMGIHGDLLFATDHDRLVIVDIEKGEIKKFVPVEGAQFLNDLAITENGVVYFSDSRSGIVHTYMDEEVAVWLNDLEGPNGLYNDNETHMIVCASGSGEVRYVNKETGEYEVMATGIGGDGVEYTGIDNYYIVSEWSGRIHVIGNDTVQKVLDTEAEKINTADIGYNMKKKEVYVPTFYDNRVVAYALKTE